MMKKQFLSQHSVSAFIERLSNLSTRDVPLNKEKNKNGQNKTLTTALENYKWPPKSVRLEMPSGELVLPALSELKYNQKVLDTLGQGLRESLTKPSNDDNVGIWVRCILQWGGVYAYSKQKKLGNRGWLEEQLKNKSLFNYLINIRDKISTSEQDDVGLEIDGLRSNAGLTKVYSLLLPNFIIYDSRVAATLSWLVHTSADLWDKTPNELRFATMRAKTSKSKGKLRTADQRLFPYFAPSGEKNFQKHLLWNIRANWILEAVINKNNSLGIDSKFKTVRDLEAALFAIGDDLRKF